MATDNGKKRVPDEMQLRQRIADCLLQASRIYRRPFPQPTLRLDQRGRCAGTSYNFV